MRQFQQLQQLIDQIPPWGQIAIAILLVLYSILSIYGRINTRVGAKVFSKIPESEIRTNKVHIVSYTIIPVIVTVGYLYLLSQRHL